MPRNDQPFGWLAGDHLDYDGQGLRSDSRAMTATGHIERPERVQPYDGPYLTHPGRSGRAAEEEQFSEVILPRHPGTWLGVTKRQTANYNGPPAPIVISLAINGIGRPESWSLEAR